MQVHCNSKAAMTGGIGFGTSRFQADLLLDKYFTGG